MASGRRRAMAASKFESGSGMKTALPGESSAYAERENPAKALAAISPANNKMRPPRVMTATRPPANDAHRLVGDAPRSNWRDVGVANQRFVSGVFSSRGPTESATQEREGR